MAIPTRRPRRKAATTARPMAMRTGADGPMELGAGGGPVGGGARDGGGLGPAARREDDDDATCSGDVALLASLGRLRGGGELGLGFAHVELGGFGSGRSRSWRGRVRGSRGSRGLRLRRD